MLVNYVHPNEIEILSETSSYTINEVNFIPTEIFTMFPNLKSFTMTKHRTLREFATGDFLNAINLTTVDLGRNKLQKIECGVFSPFAELTESIFQRAETQKISNGDILYPLHKLEYLYLPNNEISRIEPNAFSGLKHLKLLSLNSNELTGIRRRTFDGLSAIEFLYLCCNQIETIENGALDLPSLTWLHLGENKLKRFSNVVFDRLPKLEFLSLN